jgi:hypothetical protein
VPRSLVVALSLALLVGALLVPAAFAADPGTGPSASDQAPSPSDDGAPPSGDISVDPPFATSTPVGSVLAATGRPERTLPPTDTTGLPTAPGGSGLQVLLVVLAAISSFALLAGRLPDARRR